MSYLQVVGGEYLTLTVKMGLDAQFLDVLLSKKRPTTNFKFFLTITTHSI